MHDITRPVTDSEATDPEDILELCLQHARDHRDEFTLWMAILTLTTDDVATADEVLQDRLLVLQDRVENMMRARLGFPDREASKEQA